MDNKKIILNPSSIQSLDQKFMEEKIKKMEELAKEQEKRFDVIADKIIKVLIENSVLVSEVQSVIKGVMGRINPKIDGATVEKILKL